MIFKRAMELSRRSRRWWSKRCGERKCRRSTSFLVALSVCLLTVGVLAWKSDRLSLPSADTTPLQLCEGRLGVDALSDLVGDIPAGSRLEDPGLNALATCRVFFDDGWIEVSLTSDAYFIVPSGVAREDDLVQWPQAYGCAVKPFDTETGLAGRAYLVSTGQEGSGAVGWVVWFGPEKCTLSYRVVSSSSSGWQAFQGRQFEVKAPRLFRYIADSYSGSCGEL